MVPLFFKLSLVLCSTILIMRLSKTIESMVSSTIEVCNDAMVNNLFVGGCKAVVEIIGIAKNTVDFGNSGF